jgi:hypothetical protein
LNDAVGVNDPEEREDLVDEPEPELEDDVGLRVVFEGNEARDSEDVSTRSACAGEEFVEND